MKLTSFFIPIFFLLLLSTVSNAKPQKVETISSLELKKVLKESIGYPIVLNYWATWCKGCKPSLRKFAKIQEKYKKKGLRVIAVSVDGPSDKMALALVNFLYNESGDYFAKYISKGGETKKIMTVIDKDWLEIVPVTYLLNKKGKVFKRFVGNRSIRQLETDLKNIL